MNKTRYIPSIVMLSAGFVVCIVTYINKYSLISSLEILFFTMLAFLMLGCLIRKIVEKFIVIPMIEQTAAEVLNDAGAENEESENEKNENNKDDKIGKKKNNKNDKS